MKSESQFFYMGNRCFCINEEIERYREDSLLGRFWMLYSLG